MVQGDTVVSMMMTCLASGLSMRLALHIANGAAGIVVSKVGTYPIHRSELLIYGILLSIVFNLNLYTQRRDEATYCTNGKTKVKLLCLLMVVLIFFIAGHITYLQEAAQLGDHLIIGLNSDDSVRRLKRKRVPSYVKRIEQHY